MPKQKLLIRIAIIALFIAALALIVYLVANKPRTVVDDLNSQNIQNFSAEGIIMDNKNPLALKVNIFVVRHTPEGNAVVTESREVKIDPTKTRVSLYGNPMKYTDLKVGDKVVIESSQNLFEKESITANKIDQKF
jgi:hypothetical protein